jgi:hypothetical protein
MLGPFQATIYMNAKILSRAHTFNEPTIFTSIHTVIVVKSNMLGYYLLSGTITLQKASGDEAQQESVLNELIED